MIADHVVSTIMELVSVRFKLQNYITALIKTPECLMYRVPKEYHTLADLVEVIVDIIDKDEDGYFDSQRIELIDAVLPLVNEIGILGVSLQIKRDTLINKKR